VLGLGGAPGVAPSPDGANVYVTGGADDALAVFARDSLTGALTFVEAERYEDGGHGIRRPTAVTVTADGASVYVAGHDEKGVVAFSRNPATGALTFIGTTRNPAGLKGLAGAFALAASPDQAYVYVAAENDHAVAVLRRDATTGALTFVESQRAGRLGVSGLKRASAVAVSPDNAFVYVLGHDDDAVAAFATDHCGNGAIGADEECDDGNLVAGDGCSATCRLELCGAMPVVGCRTPVEPKASDLVVFHKHARSAREELTWRWTKGEATSPADFGDPSATTSYALCVYDLSPASQPRIALAAPAGGSCAGSPCWSEPSPTSLRYKDHWRTPTGVTLIDLQPGDDGEARAAVIGRGENMALPALPFVPPVVVQLRNTETGVCWEAAFAAPTANDGTQFTSKSE
jgi:cysteine-rich repeat protein